MNGIYFPGFGIFFDNVPSGFTIFGFEIKFYGILIAIGFLLAYFTARYLGKKNGLDEELYMDYLIILIPCALVGARLYYVIFNFGNFSDPSVVQTLLNIVNFRNGGLAVYGGLILGVIAAVIYTKMKKVDFFRFSDPIAYGILVGQILGRWGNFFNREAFGAYTSSIIRMAIPLDYFKNEGSLTYLEHSGIISNQMLVNTEVVKGYECITVYPTFLMEGVWNFLVLVLLLLYYRHRKVHGEISLLYVLFYGIGRFMIEGLRSDSLMAGSLKVSQIVAVLCIIGGAAGLIYRRLKCERISETVGVPDVGKNVAEADVEKAAVEEIVEESTEETAVEEDGEKPENNE